MDLIFKVLIPWSLFSKVFGINFLRWFKTSNREPVTVKREGPARLAGSFFGLLTDLIIRRGA
jgi:hypothetical protein